MICKEIIFSADSTLLLANKWNTTKPTYIRRILISSLVKQIVLGLFYCHHYFEYFFQTFQRKITFNYHQVSKFVLFLLQFKDADKMDKFIKNHLQKYVKEKQTYNLEENICLFIKLLSALKSCSCSVWRRMRKIFERFSK